MQDEIKITGVTTFVNPYTEPDEEEEQANAKEKNANDEENVCSLIFETPLIWLHFLSLLQGFCELIFWICFGIYFRTRLAHGIVILELEHLSLELRGWAAVVLVST